MKKLLVLLLVICTAVSVVACGSDNDKAKKEAKKTAEAKKEMKATDFANASKYEEVKDNLGKLINSFDDATGTSTTYNYEGLAVAVDTEGQLMLVSIDYSKLSHKKIVSFKGIDGTFKKDDVKKTLGEIYATCEETQSGIKYSNLVISSMPAYSNYIRIDFDENERVVGMLIGQETV